MERAREGKEQAFEGAARLRSTAELAHVAIDTQRRLLAQILIPHYRQLLLAVQPGEDPELPHPNSDFTHLVSVLRGLGEPLRVLDEELQWRRNKEAELERELEWSHQHIQHQLEEIEWRRKEMDRLFDVMKRSALTRVVALEKSRKRVLSWGIGTKGEEPSRSEAQEDGA